MSHVHVNSYDWENAYEKWRKDVFDNANQHVHHIKPTSQQALALRMIHERQVNEFYRLHNQPMPFAESTDPLLHLIHGLPGAGKSELLKWV